MRKAKSKMMGHTILIKSTVEGRTSSVKSDMPDTGDTRLLAGSLHQFK